MSRGEVRPIVTPRAQIRPRTAVAGAVLVTAGALALLVATEPRLAIVWDEGYTLGRETRIRDWLRAMRDPAGFAATWNPPAPDLVQTDRIPLPPPTPGQINTRAKLFAPRVLAWFWPFAREEPHGHPPFYAILGLVGDAMVPAWTPLPRARLGPMLAFAATAGALFAFVLRRWGPWPAAAAAGAWVLQPRLFGHAHYAAYDAPLTCLWVGSILAFTLAVEPGESPRRHPRWGWTVLFGVLAGWAADTKLTGWLLPLPFLAWAILYRDRRGLLALVVGGVVGLVTLYLFNPAFWLDPVGGVERFVRSNTTRAESQPIRVLFLGHVYDTPRESLPWYNTLAWTALVTPVGLLLLAIAGVVRAVRLGRSDRFGPLAVGHWAFLLLLRSLPHTPGHDGVRQFLPAFGCLAVVAGLGAAELVEHWGRWARIVIAVSLAEAAVSVAAMMPVPLSYYSPLVGGLPGATARGMEPTYYWDALTDDTLDWLNANTPPGSRVLFATNPTSWLYLRQVGRLRSEIVRPGTAGPIAWYVLQNRPGAFAPWDRALLRRGRPKYVVRKWGVPLVLIYPYSELERVLSPGSDAAIGPRPHPPLRVLSLETPVMGCPGPSALRSSTPSFSG